MEDNREKLWMDAILRKEKSMTDEEYDFEMFPQVLFEDEHLEFSKEYWSEYRLLLKKNGNGGSFALLEQCLNDPLEDWCGDDPAVKGFTTLEYIRSKGFPITFKTWD